MQRTTSKRTLLALSLLAAGSLAAAVPAHAQAVLSTAPFVPLQEMPAAELPPASAPPPTEPDQSPDPVAPLFQIPLIFNESVESQIEFFTTRGRSVFQAWLDRSARYVPLMKKIFREYNLPEDLVYVAMIESGFNFHAVSPKKAVGIWQFMKATAREYGLTADPWVDERRDPIKSTRAAAAHFKDLYNLFGSWPLAVASYNAGMGRVQGAVVKAKSEDYWELRNTRYLRSETQEYVPRYMAALIIARDPGAYGFTDPDTEPFAYEEIIVPQSTDLRRLAASTGATYEQLCDLNPELLRRQTPQSRYVLRVPPGTGPVVEQQVVQAAQKSRKAREERKRARSGGLLFTGLSSTYRQPLPAPLSPAALVSRYGHQLDMTSTLLSGRMERAGPGGRGLP